MAPPTNLTTDQWLSAAAYRRTVYTLKDTSHVPDARIEEIVKQVLSFNPSSYNTQVDRVTVVLGPKHKQLWQIIIDAVQPVLEQAGPGVWDAMRPRLEGHKSAYGSVLFWVSDKALDDARETHKAAAQALPQFAEHASAIAQILVWTALELEGFGANLQHLGIVPGVSTALQAFLGLPADYSLKAHLNFGEEAGEHPEKPAKLPLSETFKIVT
ncbi:nitroreductase family protein [Sporothrix brasiliensis 5110]|uniref:Nitroreductase family protein n=1 Tax=Sporothrix brasiliensis 5110 TaxID=1398154 RepID=A0A0C2IWN2_9PEZI|nr:nitroreductase family protein [Sporothrix brasiliensis 5110]KIH93561.1 nitroreductase family protein [Sporothrix brasiliensis 5110]